MSQHQVRIADEGCDQCVIDRLELSKKLERADYFIHRVQERLKALERKRNTLLRVEGVEDVSKNFEAITNKTSTLSKEL